MVDPALLAAFKAFNKGVVYFPGTWWLNNDGDYDIYQGRAERVYWDKKTNLPTAVIKFQGVAERWSVTSLTQLELYSVRENAEKEVSEAHALREQAQPPEEVDTETDEEKKEEKADEKKQLLDDSRGR